MAAIDIHQLVMCDGVATPSSKRIGLAVVEGFGDGLLGRAASGKDPCCASWWAQHGETRGP